MKSLLDTKRIAIFLALAFGIAWAIGLVIYLTGGLTDSPELIPGSGFTLAALLLAVGYMWAPALGNIGTRLLTGEGWKDTWLRPHFKRGWPWWLAGWFVPGLLTILGAAIFFTLFPHFFDSQLTTVKELLASSGAADTVNPWLIMVAQTASALLIAPLINSLFTFGEEFGWRAYLQPKLMPLGMRKTMLLMGIIWGVWHWPVIAMGYNYGVDYPGAPWLGPLAMVWFTFVVGTFLGWITLRGNSVWPAVIGHAAVNGIAGWGVLFTQGQPNSLLGPLPVGVVASIPWTLVMLWIMVSPRAMVSATASTEKPVPQTKLAAE